MNAIWVAVAPARARWISPWAEQQAESGQDSDQGRHDGELDEGEAGRVATPDPGRRADRGAGNEASPNGR